MDAARNRVLAEQEIDLARCRAQWSALPDLLQKYRNMITDEPDKKIYELTVSVELELIRLLRDNKKYSSDLEMKGWDHVHRFDHPHHITLLPIIDPALVTPLVDRLSAYCADELEEEDMTPLDWQLQFTKIILARIYFESGQYEEALHMLQNLALRMEDVQTGYGLVLLVQARAIKGICLEQQGDDESAIEAYEAAWNSVEAQPQERGAMLSFWIEECIYRGSLLSLRASHSVKTLKFMRAYIQLVSSHWSPQWRMYRRWVIFKHYANYLIESCKEGSYETSNNEFSSEMTLFEEVSNLLNLYRTLFTMVASVASHEEQCQYAIELTRIIFHAHDTIGWGEIIQIKRILQFLYQMKNYTFNHPTVSRCMFFTLMRLGSLEEAKCSLSAYLDLMGVPDFNEQSILNDKREHAYALTTIHFPEETVKDVIPVILVGIQLYGAEEENGKMAVALSELILALANSSADHVHSKDMVAIYRAAGASYSLLASQSVEASERSVYHEKSLYFFQEAVAINDQCWQSHYASALQQAQMRDINSAMKSVTRSIEINPQHIHSWHLLALLHSCKQTDTLEKALQALEAAIQLIYPSQQPIVDSSMMGIHSFSWFGEKNANDVFHRAHAYVSVRMTQLMLKEQLNGPEFVMNQFEDLFSVYTHLSGLLGLSQMSVYTEEPMPLSPKPRRKSSISIIRRTSISSITSSLGGRRRKASLAESEKQSKKSESDADDGSEGTPSPRAHRSNSFLKKNKNNMPTRTMSATTNNSTLSEADLKRRDRELIDLGIAQRIGTPATSPGPQSPKTTNSPLKREITSSVSLASMLTPSYSMGTIKTNSVSSRSFSLANTGSKMAVNRDGLIVSTFNQHHHAFEIRKKTQWQSLLVTLWLMSVKTFIQAGQLEEANKAISEAEQLGLGDPNVWHQLAQLSLKAREGLQDPIIITELEQVATDAYHKALVLDADHIPSQIGQAIRWMEGNEWDLAEGMLEQLTYGLGWDSSEAWYQLSKIKEHEGELDRAKECLLYALELNESQPMRQLSILPRFI